MRPPPGLFLNPGAGYTHTPLRDYPQAPDEPELIERIQTATSIRDEPEAIGPRWLTDWAQVALLHRSQQHALDVANAQQRRPQLPPHARLQDLHRRAKHAHVDISHEIHIMRLDLEFARIRGQPPRQRTIIRLTRIETLLDGVSA